MNTPIKCCIICNKSKPITEFSKRDAQTYRGYCLVCNRARQLKDYYKHIKKERKLERLITEITGTRYLHVFIHQSIKSIKRNMTENQK